MLEDLVVDSLAAMVVAAVDQVAVDTVVGLVVEARVGQALLVHQMQVLGWATVHSGSHEVVGLLERATSDLVM